MSEAKPALTAFECVGKKFGAKALENHLARLHAAQTDMDLQMANDKLGALRADFVAAHLLTAGVLEPRTPALLGYILRLHTHKLVPETSLAWLRLFETVTDELAKQLTLQLYGCLFHFAVNAAAELRARTFQPVTDSLATLALVLARAEARQDVETAARATRGYVHLPMVPGANDFVVGTHLARVGGKAWLESTHLPAHKEKALRGGAAYLEHVGEGPEAVRAAVAALQAEADAPAIAATHAFRKAESDAHEATLERVRRRGTVDTSPEATDVARALQKRDPRERDAILEGLTFTPPHAVFHCAFEDATERMRAEMADVLVAHRADPDIWPNVYALERLGPGFGELLVERLRGQPVSRSFLSMCERRLAPGAFQALVSAFGATCLGWEDELSAALAAVEGPRSTVYVLAPGEGDAEGLCQIGGAPAGIAPGDVPAGFSHALTIDLQEVPQLASAHPGQRTLSLWIAPRRDELLLVTRTQSQVDARPAARGRALTLRAFECPASVFDPDAPAAPVRQAAALLRGRPGVLLGQPLWVQPRPSTTRGRFLMQVDRRLAPMLGKDSIAYVFTETLVVQTL